MAKLPGGRTARETELCLGLAIEGDRADRSLPVNRAAGWFLQAHGWEDLQERIAEALSSYDPPLGLVHPGVAELLEDARLKGQTDLAIVELPNDRRGRGASQDLVEALASDDVLRFQIGGEPTFTVEHGSLPRIREALDVDVSATGPLAEVKLSWGRGSIEAKQYARSLVLDLLEQAGVMVHDHRFASSIVAVLVPQHQALLTVGVLEGAPSRLTPLLPCRGA